MRMLYSAFCFAVDSLGREPVTEHDYVPAPAVRSDSKGIGKEPASVLIYG